MHENRAPCFIKKISNRGFTLIEVIAVLILMGILSAVALSRATSTIDTKLAGEFDTLKGHLRYAQAWAMNDTVDWNMSLTAAGYTLLRNGVPQNLPGTGPAHTFASGVSLTSGAGIISFDSWGSPGDTTLTLTLNGSRTITITRNTGFIP